VPTNVSGEKRWARRTRAFAHPVRGPTKRGQRVSSDSEQRERRDATPATLYLPVDSNIPSPLLGEAFDAIWHSSPPMTSVRNDEGGRFIIIAEHRKHIPSTLDDEELRVPT
jgi:hypothetical protein